MTENLKGVLMMCLSMAGFTINDSFMKAVTVELPLFQAIALRGLITIVALLTIALATGALRWRPARGEVPLIGLRSLAEVVSTALFLIALTKMDFASLSAIMQALPLAVTLGAALVFGDKIGWRRMAAILVGFAGVLMIIRPGTDSFDIWSLMGVASVVAVVVRDLAVRPMAGRLPTVIVALAAALSVTSMGLIVATIGGWQPLGGHEALLILGAGTALTFGYMAAVQAMRHGDIAAVAPFRYTSLFWALVLGWFVFGTWPDEWTLIGSAVVVAAGLFTILREARLRRASA